MARAADMGGERHGTPDVYRRNIEEIARLENREQVEMGPSDHVANLVTAFSGSMPFVLVHVVLFATWIIANLRWRFDPYPFQFLGLALAIEAIFLSTFVLISQNRQAVQADRRAKVDLQISLISEREVTKLMEMISEVHERLGIEHSHDDELEQMRKQTHVEEVADAVDEAQRRLYPEAARGPESAADTEA